MQPHTALCRAQYGPLHCHVQPYVALIQPCKGPNRPLHGSLKGRTSPYILLIYPFQRALLSTEVMILRWIEMSGLMTESFSSVLVDIACREATKGTLKDYVRLYRALEKVDINRYRTL